MTHHHLWTPGWYTSAEKRRGASCARCKLMARQVEREVKIIFEIRDSIHWFYGSGFPKSLDVSKSLDAAAGAQRDVIGYDETRARPNRTYESGAIGNVGGNGKISDRTDNGATMTAPATDDAKKWSGWGTALKPAHEPIVLARKPLVGTVAANVLAHGTGALNIDGCRIGETVPTWPTSRAYSRHDVGAPRKETQGAGNSPAGRWPANIILDEDAAAELDRQSGDCQSGIATKVYSPTLQTSPSLGAKRRNLSPEATYGDHGGASRFFYIAKPSRAERDLGCGRNHHPTVKPVALMRYLCRLITPPGGTVIDPFAGSGTTGIGAVLEGLGFLGIEREEEYAALARGRLAYAEMNPAAFLAESKPKAEEQDPGQLSMFGDDK